LGTKSDLITYLKDISEGQSEAPMTTCVILDGAAIVHMLKPTPAKMFDKYTLQVFIPYVLLQLRRASLLDFVWDQYVSDSLKDTARAKHGKGVHSHVAVTTAIPQNWPNFLCEASNKAELYAFLFKALIHLPAEDGKELVITDGLQRLTNGELQNLDMIAPCSHKETDRWMLLHAIHAAHHGHHHILIHSVDTDVVVLAVLVTQQLSAEAELWVAFGTGHSLRYLVACLGPEKACALPMFHTLTGCDMVLSFAGHGKKTVWETWKSLPELTDAGKWTKGDPR